MIVVSITLRSKCCANFIYSLKFYCSLNSPPCLICLIVIGRLLVGDSRCSQISIFCPEGKKLITVCLQRKGQQFNCSLWAVLLLHMYLVFRSTPVGSKWLSVTCIQKVLTALIFSTLQYDSVVSELINTDYSQLMKTQPMSSQHQPSGD